MAPLAMQRRFKGESAAQRHDSKHVPRHDCGHVCFKILHKSKYTWHVLSDGDFLVCLLNGLRFAFASACIQKQTICYCHVFLGNDYWSTGGGNDWAKQTEKSIVTEATNKSTWMWKPTIEHKRPLQLPFFQRHRLHKDSKWTVSMLYLSLVLYLKKKPRWANSSVLLGLQVALTFGKLSI